MFLRLNVALAWESLDAAILTFQSDVTNSRYSSLVSQFPSRASWTPSVHLASLDSSCGIATRCCWSSLIDSLPSFCVFVTYFHLFWMHWKLMRYQKHLVGMSAPPVAHSSPSQLSTDFCIAKSAFWLVICGPWMHKLVSSTKAKPTRVFSLLEMAVTMYT